MKLTPQQRRDAAAAMAADTASASTDLDGKVAEEAAVNARALDLLAADTTRPRKGFADYVAQARAALTNQNTTKKETAAKAE